MGRGMRRILIPAMCYRAYDLLTDAILSGRGLSLEGEEAQPPASEGWPPPPLPRHDPQCLMCGKRQSEVTIKLGTDPPLEQIEKSGVRVYAQDKNRELSYWGFPLWRMSIIRKQPCERTANRSHVWARPKGRAMPGPVDEFEGLGI